MIDKIDRGPIRYVWAVLLSVLFPGAAQVYAGRWHRGLTLAGIALCCASLARLYIDVFAPSKLTFLGLAAYGVIGIGFVIWVMLDAVRLVRHARTQQLRPFPKSVTAFAIVSIAIQASVQALWPLGWRAFDIPSTSNMPTLLVGDYILVDTTKRGRVPRRGDLMIFRYPRDPRIMYVKRIVGLPGDHVQMTGGQLFINGIEAARAPQNGINYDTGDNEGGFVVPAKEYVETLPRGMKHAILKYSDAAHVIPDLGIDINNTGLYSVPNGTVFVLGDSRDNSQDSRFPDEVGFVPFSNLIGRAGLIYYSKQAADAKRHQLTTIRWSRILTSLEPDSR